MHSKIFQISKEKIKMSDIIREEKYYDNFVGAIADYVSDLDKEMWKENWDWLSDHTNGALEIKNKKLTIVNKKKFFEIHYAKFQELAKKAAEMSIEQFMSNNYEIDMTNHINNPYKTSAPMLIENLYSEFDDRFGFYIDDGDDGYYGLITFDSFMRSVNDGDVFYLGSVIDYHM